MFVGHPCEGRCPDTTRERDVRQVLGAWLLFLVLAGPDAVRMVTDRSALSAGVPPDSVSAAPVVPPRSRVHRPSAPRAVPGDFRADPLRFLSSAPPDSLVLLPGIGPVLAARIADARTGKSPYTTWNDLLAVKGIGPKTVERLRSLVTP